MSSRKYLCVSCDGIASSGMFWYGTVSVYGLIIVCGAVGGGLTGGYYTEYCNSIYEKNLNSLLQKYNSISPNSSNKLIDVSYDPFFGHNNYYWKEQGYEQFKLEMQNNSRYKDIFSADDFDKYIKFSWNYVLNGDESKSAQETGFISGICLLSIFGILSFVVFFATDPFYSVNKFFKNIFKSLKLKKKNK